MSARGGQYVPEAQRKSQYWMSQAGGGAVAPTDTGGLQPGVSGMCGFSGFRCGRRASLRTPSGAAGRAEGETAARGTTPTWGARTVHAGGSRRRSTSSGGGIASITLPPPSRSLEGGEDNLRCLILSYVIVCLKLVGFSLSLIFHFSSLFFFSA